MKKYPIIIVALLAFCATPLLALEIPESAKYYEPRSNAIIASLERDIDIPSNQKFYPDIHDKTVTYSDVYQDLLDSYEGFLADLKKPEYNLTRLWKRIKDMDHFIYALGGNTGKLYKEQEYYANEIGTNLYYLKSNFELIDLTYFIKWHKKEFKKADKVKTPLLFVISELNRRGHGDINYKILNNTIVESLKNDIVTSKDITLKYVGLNGVPTEVTLSSRYQELLDKYQELLTLMAAKTYSKKQIIRATEGMDRAISLLKTGLIYENGRLNTDGTIAAQITEKQKFYTDYIGYNVYFLKSKNKFINIPFVYNNYKEYMQHQTRAENPLIFTIAKQVLSGEIIDLPARK